MSRTTEEIIEPLGERFSGNINPPKSPLRYPGGKSRAVKFICRQIPLGTERLCSPFVGGGSVELACASQGIKVFAYDNFEPLVHFWQSLIVDPEALSKIVGPYHPLEPDSFYNLQKTFGHIENKEEQAAIFYVLNRASYSGTTLSGGMSPKHPRFTKSSIRYISEFNISNFQVEQADFRDSLARHTEDFLYLDPPYANGEALYGIGGSMHKDFKHEDLADILKNRPSWILSYNDCDLVRDLYRGHEILNASWAYGMNGSKKSNEVLILSKDLVRSAD